MPSIGRTTQKRLIPQTDLVRSAPIYVETPDGVVTLIKEGFAPSNGAGEVEPVAVYVIDRDGVRKVPLVRSGSKRRLLALAILLLAALVFWLFRPHP